MNFSVGGGYWLRLPVFGWFTSKGHSLEGNGVDPDVSVEISPDALADGHDNQMETAIDIVNGL
jgi:C-terminal processing protease CtpA/Prc